uniref:Dirigent protein n=1 Tax=Gossypium raimondii TaxID=29730 RepID=A0A0D2SIW5_GOSRA|nr:hypothetical protein B456_007G238200 [Gossypium raimondii]
MASFATQILFILLFTLFSTFFIKINGEFLRQSIMEKITCLHFYFHDIVDGKHPTAMQIIRVPNRTATSLVTTFMGNATVGGSRIFRFGRGCALAKTVWFNKNGNAIVEYNVTVVH